MLARGAHGYCTHTGVGGDRRTATGARGRSPERAARRRRPQRSRDKRTFATYNIIILTLHPSYLHGPNHVPIKTRCATAIAKVCCGCVANGVAGTRADSCATQPTPEPTGHIPLNGWTTGWTGCRCPPAPSRRGGSSPATARRASRTCETTGRAERNRCRPSEAARAATVDVRRPLTNASLKRTRAREQAAKAQRPRPQLRCSLRGNPTLLVSRCGVRTFRWRSQPPRRW